MARGKAANDPPPPLIYVDTCVWVDLVTQRGTPHPVTSEPRWISATALLSAVDDRRVILGTSALVDAEIGRFALLNEIDGPVLLDDVRRWLDVPTTRYAEIDRLVARDAARLAKEWRPHAAGSMSGADAVHLAAAVRLGCDYLMTHDGGFPIGHTVDGVKVRHTETVWVPSLLTDTTPAAE